MVETEDERPQNIDPCSLNGSDGFFVFPYPVNSRLPDILEILCIDALYPHEQPLAATFGAQLQKFRVLGQPHIGLATLLYAIIFVNVKKLPKGDRVPIRQILATTKEAIWALGVPIIILGGIYMGIFTPTEAAGVSAVYATFVGFLIYRELNIKNFIQACFNSAITSAELILLCGAAGVLGWVFTVLQVPQFLSSTLLDISQSPFTFLIVMNIFVLFFGCFVDGAPAIVALAPLLTPIAIKYGIDPVHFGVILTANMAIGMFTPPFGLNLIVASSVTKMPMEKLLPGCIPFFIASLIALFLITYVEPISMWLPNLIY